jgi:hypothetical protein
MCHGNLDAKLMMRDIEERMKGVAFGADKSETPGETAAGGLGVWLRAWFGRKPRKDLMHG